MGALTRAWEHSRTTANSWTTSSLSALFIRICFPGRTGELRDRCTAGDRSDPLGADAMWTKRELGLASAPVPSDAGSRASEASVWLSGDNGAV
jgi:hypothetical protein